MYAEKIDDEALVNLFRPVHEFESARSVDDAVESVDVIVTGAEPNATNCVHDADPEHDTVVVAVVPTRPVEPMYATPCDRDASLRALENVDEADENRPPVKPIVVEVLAPYAVNGSM